MGLASWHISGTYSFEVAPRILVNLWTLILPYILARKMQKVINLIAGPLLIDGCNTLSF
jgi:hypothetical protein